MVQGYFRRAIEAHGNDARARTNGGIAGHIAVLPRPRPHPSWQHRLELDRNGSGETNLTAVSVSAQHEIKIGMGSLAINLRCVRQQDRELTAGYRESGFFDVIHSVEMCIVDSRQIDPLVLTDDCFAFIEQHANAHGFEPRNHLNRIVVAEHGVDWLFQMTSQSRDTIQRGLEGPKSPTPIIASQDTDIVLHAANQLDESVHGNFIHIHVKVANVENGEALKEGR